MKNSSLLSLLIPSFFAISIACVQAPAREPQISLARARGENSRGSGVPETARGAARAGTLAPRDFTTDRPQVDKLALLVGIDRYAPGTPDRLGNLKGCVSDTQRVRRVLIDRYGFASEDILVLDDADATHANIVSAFDQWLIGRAGENTEVLFWFSGHGSRVPDASGIQGAEQDGKDTTFVAYDSRAHGEDGAFDISDDEVRSLVAALTKKTVRVTIVTDSCHSGGGTRGVETGIKPRYRGADEGNKPVDRARLKATFWPAGVPLLEDGDPDNGESQRRVHIAACRNSQLAQEIDATDDEGRPEANGALTFFLLQCLAVAQPKMTYRALAEQTAVRLSTDVPQQTVCYEGALDRELFGARFEERPPGFLARAQSKTDVRIDAGSMHGLREGSILVLRDAQRNAIVGRASAKRVTALACTAHWIDPLPREIPQGALRAIEETRPAGQVPLSVFIPDATLAERFTHSEYVRVERSDPRAAEYQLRVDGTGELALYAPCGLRIWREPNHAARQAPEIVAVLEDEFHEELRYRTLFALAKEPGTLAVEARFLAPTEPELAQFLDRFESSSSALLPSPSDDRGLQFEHEYPAIGSIDYKKNLRLAMLEVKNAGDRDVYISVLSVAEDRGRHPIYPNSGERDNVLPPGAVKRIPVNVVAAPATFDPRPMRDRYLVIATKDAADFEPLTRASTMRGAEKVRMPEILQRALDQPMTRGNHSLRVEDGGFGITTVDLLVEKPAQD